MTLEGDWVTPEQARAGKVFAAFLAKAITPAVAGAQGFRPADPDTAPAGLVTKANGVDPKQPARVLRAAGAEGAGQDQGDLARGPQAGQRDDGLRQLRLDGRGEQARAGQGRAQELLPPGRAAGPDRPDQVLQQDHAAGRAGADARQPRQAARRDGHDPARGRHARARRDARRDQRRDRAPRQGRDQRGRAC